MSSEKRKYTLSARAEKQAETRRRIVEATSALHEELGPARTTVADIARRAGVNRLTVYNNFPHEQQLFAACGDYWLAHNPPPDPSAAFQMDSPVECLRAVLVAFYGWYRKTARANEHMQRDRLVIPTFDALMKIRMDQPFATLVDSLAVGFPAAADPALSVRAAIALALDFWVWRRLAAEGLTDDESAALMVGAVKAAAQA
ncbi:MAG: hypothetical protein PVSMB7_18400 [Chloroflexota bacterium]